MKRDDKENRPGVELPGDQTNQQPDSITDPSSSSNEKNYGDLIEHTIVYDELKKAVGLSPALVYGMIKRYENMETGVCFASFSDIAGRLGISSKTVERGFRILRENGWIQAKRKGRWRYFITTKRGIDLDDPGLDGLSEELLKLEEEKLSRQNVVTRTDTESAHKRHIQETDLSTKESVAVTGSSPKYSKEISSQNDEYILETGMEQRDLVKLKRGVVKEQEKRERRRRPPIRDLTAWMLEAVRGAWWRSLLPGYDEAVDKRAGPERGSQEYHRLAAERAEADEIDD